MQRHESAKGQKGTAAATILVQLQQVKTKRKPAMATTPAHAAAAGEAVMSYGRVGTRRIPPRLGFLSKPSSRWAAISLPPGPRHAAPAAAAAKERVAEEEEGPAWVELEPIASEQQLDQALAEAQQLDLPIVLLW